MEALEKLATWIAPLLSTLIITYATTLIARGEKIRDEARAEDRVEREQDAVWRKSVDCKLSDIDDKVNRSIAAQAAQTRSDIIHKCHRYLDDLGRASTEEKQALDEEHRQYAKFCDDLDVENNFINNLVARVMALPEREV